MIFKSWSQPQKPDVWAKYASKKNILLVMALIGNLISGFTEFKAMDNTLHGILAMVLLEGGVWFTGSMFFDNLFSYLRNKDLSSAIFGVLGLSGLCFIVYLSMNMSMIGKTITVNDMNEPPAAETVDSTKYNNLKNKALEQYNADSLRIFAEVEKEKIEKRNELNNIISKQTSKKGRIMNYADYTYEKYANSIKGCESKVRQAKKELKNLNTTYKELFNSRLAVASSDKSSGLVFASSSLLHSIDSTNQVNTTTEADFKAFLASKQFFYGLLVRFGIIATLIYLFFNGLGRHLSGSFPIYKDPFAGVMSPFERIAYGLKLHIRNFWDAIADYISPSDTVEVVNKGFQFHRLDLGETVSISTQNLSPTPPQPEEITQITAPIEIKQDNTDISKENIQKPVKQQINLPPKELLRPIYRIENDNIEVVQETVEDVKAYIKQINPQKHRQNLINTFNKMKAVHNGSTRKRKVWKQDALNRLAKVGNLAFELAMLGYNIEVVGEELKIDEVGKPSLPAYENFISLVVPDNDYKFPMDFKYNPVAMAA